MDLNLDQIVANLAESKPLYSIVPYYYVPLRRVEDILYRQAVGQDLEDEFLMVCVRNFSQKLMTLREHLAQAEKLHHPYQKRRWFLDGVGVYCGAVSSFAHDLSQSHLRSKGLLAFREYVADYLQSEKFSSLRAKTVKLKEDLSSITYCLAIKGNRVSVRRFGEEPDYSAVVEATFARFQHEGAGEVPLTFNDWPEMNHVEAQVLDFVAKLFPDVFASLNEFYEQHRDFWDENIANFDREVQFYIAYLEYISGIKRSGLNFCYPQISTSKAVFSTYGFDLALAHKLQLEKRKVVTNDFYLDGQERMIVVTGPNQGGKTTFARMFGQIHYLASLGLPVPGSQARLFLVDRVFTHFEKSEDAMSLHGKLQDELVRMRELLNRATSDSLIVMNEVFASTTLQDALWISRQVLQKIRELDALCVCVTFIDELASFSEDTVSMVSVTDPDDPTLRTFKLIRCPANGRSFAISIARKYRLTYEELKERIKG